ncbi:probable glutamate receptor [Branchiostoma floridae]|uniref:Probable glutamate receptor n=1 Tax=Branchiostoma floridae TaxID=7739 RepID=A0A9J7MLY5_BRAFL|nr:probable glutamate receptor [Branchiostoma floridae]
MDLLAWLSSELGFTYSLYAVSDGEYGRYREETGNWTGMVGDVVSGTADIAVAIVSITSRRQAVGDFTLPFYANGVTLAMRKSQTSKSNWGFVKPFEGRLWATILMTAVAVAIFQGVANFVTRKRDPETEEYVHRGREILGTNAGFGEYMWQSWVLLVQLSPDFLPRSLSGRLH